MKKIISLPALILLVFSSYQTNAYCITSNTLSCSQTGSGWSGNTTAFNIQGYAGAQAQFNNAFATALSRWNNLSAFRFTSTNTTVNPCDANHNTSSTHGWRFDATVCGGTFGNAAAVTLMYASSLDPTLNNPFDADIVFNSAVNWGVYSGPQQSTVDFTRVAVHELGHALGLDHDQRFPAIMNNFVGTYEAPQSDDINGLIKLYGVGTVGGGGGTGTGTGIIGDAPAISAIMLLLLSD